VCFRITEPTGRDERCCTRRCAVHRCRLNLLCSGPSHCLSMHGGNRPVIVCQTAQQPHDLRIAASLLFQAPPRAQTCRTLGLSRRFTLPYTPRSNGKSKRFIQTLLREWAYATPVRSQTNAAENRVTECTSATGIDSVVVSARRRPSADEPSIGQDIGRYETPWAWRCAQKPSGLRPSPGSIIATFTSPPPLCRQYDLNMTHQSGNY
jgi:hypothetical protein